MKSTNAKTIWKQPNPVSAGRLAPFVNPALFITGSVRAELLEAQVAVRFDKHTVY